MIEEEWMAVLALIGFCGMFLCFMLMKWISDQQSEAGQKALDGWRDALKSNDELVRLLKEARMEKDDSDWWKEEK